MEKIKYRSGYKYQLAEQYLIQTKIFPEKRIKTQYIDLAENGTLIIKKGYCWDGASGPAIDTKNFMRGSLVHDAIYQLLRMELINKSYKNEADNLLREICRQDGMSWIRAWWVYRGVYRFGKSSTLSKNKKKILEAP